MFRYPIAVCVSHVFQVGGGVPFPMGVKGVCNRGGEN